MQTPTRRRRRYRVRRLEPRIVLNATAELSALGELLINGDGADDAINVGTNADGRIEIRDANDAVVPIRIDGGAVLVDSLSPAEITAQRLRVDLGGGDDALQVQLPGGLDLTEGLDLTVIDGDGNDSVEVDIASDDAFAEVTLQIEAESIVVDGRSNALDLSSGLLSGVGPNGSVTIENTLDLDLGTVQSTGEVTVDANGTVTTGIVQGENIAITASGPQSDIVVGELKVNDPDAGSVRLVADDDIVQHDENAIGAIEIIADELTLRAGNSDADGPTAIELDTQVNALNAVVGNTDRGDLIIREVDDIRLAVLNQADGPTALSTGNGLIRVESQGSIFVEDDAGVDDGPLLRANQDIIAGGGEGRIELIAADDFIAGDSVQLAAPGEEGSVTVKANNVILGEDFEINVREGEGIARRFTPRPDPDGVQPATLQDTGDPGAAVQLDPDEFDIDTAFYDVDSVSTNILTQANENDAQGTLSVDVGAEGERGLVLSIDWGSFDTELNPRFESKPGLPGDGTRVDVSHVYTQKDIVESRFNGRTSATDPLAVRFAVSHHRAIEVTGNFIQQPIDLPGFDTVSETVPGDLISSTDNPLTPAIANPGLESGRAFFVIPRIDVPVAFFPVRDVIPESVDPPAPILVSSVMTLSDVDLETADSSGTSITVREEYFQLRTLSPDPGGKDLIEPVRLPDGVLSGDKLSELFARLPDGAYEIQYVLGDTDERTILRVDLRGGEPIIIGDDLDGRSLEIRWLDGLPEAELPSIEALDRETDQESDVETSERWEIDEPAATDGTTRGEEDREEDGQEDSAAKDLSPLGSSVPVAIAVLSKNPFSRASRFLMKTQREPANVSESGR